MELGTKQIMECCTNYVKHIEKEGVDVGESYAKIEKWLKDNCKDKELRGLLRLYVLHHTILVINKKNLHCKELAQGNWDSRTTSAGRERLEKLQKEYEDEVFYDRTEYRKALKSFSDAIEPSATTKPWMYLYLIKTYADKGFGKWLKDPSHRFFLDVEARMAFAEAVEEKSE